MGAHPLSNELASQAVDAVKKHGSQDKAADALGISRSTLQSRLKSRTALKIIGTSTLRDAEGNTVLEWEKTSLDKEQQELLLRETIEAFKEDISGLHKPTKAPQNTSDELFSEYVLTDGHLGALAWGDETGDNYDTDIASRDCMAAMDRLVESTPASSRCIISQMGDYFHINDDRSQTPRGNNNLDVDSRFVKVIRVGVRAERYIIDRALEKHETVEVRNVRGNHDPEASIILDEAMKGYYNNNPRVIVHDSPKPFWAYRFGGNLVGLAHGHAPKPKTLPGLLAADYPQWWAECPFKYARHGHFHSTSSFEEIGVKVEGFRTLAAPDAWSNSMGYRSGREMQAIVLHESWGEIERHTASLRRVRSDRQPTVKAKKKPVQSR